MNAGLLFIRLLIFAASALLVFFFLSAAASRHVRDRGPEEWGAVVKGLL